MRRLAIACLLCLLAPGVQAQGTGVYKWKDARGVTQYSDTPPAHLRYSQVRPDAPPPAATPSPVLDPRCATARANIAALRSGRSDLQLDTDRDGTPDTPLPEAERADQLRMAEASARAFCPPA